MKRASLVLSCSVALCSLLSVAEPAAAQSTYVGASLFGEITRFGGIDIDDGDAFRIAPSLGEANRDGEALGFDVRVGRAITDRWGVELAFARGGAIDNELRQQFTPSILQTGVILPPGFPIPSFEYELHSEQQHTTIDTVAWLRQDLSDSAHLVFLGGASFTRIEREEGLRITDPRFAGLGIYLPYPTGLETTSYNVGPVVGTELVFDLGDHAAITGGVRLHGGIGGWLVRPGAGIRWRF